MTDYQLLKTELDVLMVYEDEVDAVAQVLIKCHFVKDVERWVWTGDSGEILKNVPPTAQVAPPQPVAQPPPAAGAQQPPGGTPVGQMPMQQGQMNPIMGTPAQGQLTQGPGLEGMTPQQMQAPQWQMQQGRFFGLGAPRFTGFDPVTGTQMGGAKGMTQRQMSGAAHRMDAGAQQRQMYEQQFGEAKPGLGDRMNTALQSGWDRAKQGAAAAKEGLGRAGTWGAEKAGQGFGAAGRGIDTAAQGIGSGYTGVKNWLSGKAKGIGDWAEERREDFMENQGLQSPERNIERRTEAGREASAAVMPGAEGNMGMFDIDQQQQGPGVTVPSGPAGTSQQQGQQGVTVPSSAQQQSSGAGDDWPDVGWTSTPQKQQGVTVPSGSGSSTGPEQGAGVTVPSQGQGSQTGVWGGKSRQRWQDAMGEGAQSIDEDHEAALGANEVWDAMRSGQEYDPAKHKTGPGFGPGSFRAGAKALNRSFDPFEHSWGYLLKGL